jgi:hypothetical protein
MRRGQGFLSDFIIPRLGPLVGLYLTILYTTSLMRKIVLYWKLVNNLNKKIMSALESVPNTNTSVELNPGNVGSSVAEQKFVPEISPTETPELSPEERKENLESSNKANEQKITRLTASIEATRSAVNDARNKVREKLGLEPEILKEDPQSVVADKDRLKKLQDEKVALGKQKEELVSQQEKEKLIKKEKGIILQQKLDELFEEFEALNPRDLENILQSEKTLLGLNVESKSMGFLSPEVAQPLARAFKEGIKLLPKILEAQPDLLKNFDQQLTEEATKNVEEKLEVEKQKIENNKVKEKNPEELKPESLDGEISQGEAVPKSNPIEGGNTENPK